MPSCRHRNTWISFSGHGEWCYECGAHRIMRKGAGNGVYPITAWRAWVGAGGENPHEKYSRRDEAYRKRMGLEEVGER